MRFLSLFSGIGGLDLGLEKSGMSCAMCVEIDEFNRKVLKKNFPKALIREDVLDVTIEDIPHDVRLVSGGFPCQDVSLAGSRKGLAGSRSTLWSEFFRIVCGVQPEWVVIENVVGLLSANKGEFFAKILRELSSIGYDAEWETIPAGAFGAPHIRERVFILAYPHEKRRKSPVFRARNLEKVSGKISARDTSRLQIRPDLAFWIRKNEGVSFSDACLAGRVDDEFSNRAYRRKFMSLGNAVLPILGEFIGECIMNYEVKHG